MYTNISKNQFVYICNTCRFLLEEKKTECNNKERTRLIFCKNRIKKCKFNITRDFFNLKN